VEQRTLKLNEFKALYKAWKTNIPGVDHLLLGLLVWLEEKLIDNRIKVELDEAIKGWESLHPHPPTISPPIYTSGERSESLPESPSDTSTRLPEMRLRAPWLDGTDDTVEGH
jgi:hypothetical protein